MVDDKYAIAYSEVLEILRYIPREDYNKIPIDKIKVFVENANDKYVFNYNPDKTLQEQNVSDITKGIIIMLFRDYIANDNQRDKIIKKQYCDRMNVENEKRKKYNPDIWANRKKENAIKNEQNNELINIEKIK